MLANQRGRTLAGGSPYKVKRKNESQILSHNLIFNFQFVLFHVKHRKISKNDLKKELKDKKLQKNDKKILQLQNVYVIIIFK